MAEKVLYIPGLGSDQLVEKQRNYIELLNRRKHKPRITFFDPKWETNEHYQTKYSRLLDLLVRHEGINTVYAVSAGAALGNRLAQEETQISRAHFVCGKVTGSVKIGQDYQERAPAFVQATEASEHALAKPSNYPDITCYLPVFDGVIEKEDMTVPGAQIKTIPILFHMPAIVYSLVRHLPRIS